MRFRMTVQASGLLSTMMKRRPSCAATAASREVRKVRHMPLQLITRLSLTPRLRATV